MIVIGCQSEFFLHANFVFMLFSIDTIGGTVIIEVHRFYHLAFQENTPSSIIFVNRVYQIPTASNNNTQKIPCDVSVVSVITKAVCVTTRGSSKIVPRLAGSWLVLRHMATSSAEVGNDAFAVTAHTNTQQPSQQRTRTATRGY